MEIDWDEISLIIEKRSSKGGVSYMIQPSEMIN